jgi:hypothetical protein
LNLIPQPGVILRFFGSVVRPGGKLLLCLQNPWNRRDLRSLAFWRGLLSLPRTGAVVWSSVETGYTYKHTVAAIRRAARPEFRPISADPSRARVCRHASVGHLGLFRLLAFARS